MEGGEVSCYRHVHTPTWSTCSASLPGGEGVWAAASSGRWLPLLREGQAGLALIVTRQVERQEGIIHNQLGQRSSQTPLPLPTLGSSLAQLEQLRVEPRVQSPESRVQGKSNRQSQQPAGERSGARSGPRGQLSGPSTPLAPGRMSCPHRLPTPGFPAR